ncbi:MAG: gluconate 2-dehydrogenase subunit 3 family protein [Bacteroidota bacterium]
MKDCYKKEDQENFLKGLTDFDKGANGFLDLDHDKQVEYVTKVHNDAQEAMKDPASKDKPRPFIMTMKELTVVGILYVGTWCYASAPIRSSAWCLQGCIPLSEVGKNLGDLVSSPSIE